MITFDKDGHRFIYRVAGVAIQNGAVLVHQAEGDDHWSLPGGRAELGETAESTLRREMAEELGAQVAMRRPLWFVENFFTYDGKAYHELGLYFLMEIIDPGPVLTSDGPMIGFEDNVKLIFRWVPADPAALTALPLLPAFLQGALKDPPEALTHVVNRD